MDTQKGNDASAQFNVIVNANVGQIQALIEFLEVTPKGLYTEQPNSKTSAIGMHMRHVLDFYSQILKGSKTGEVSYDSRIRDKSIQTDPKNAIELARNIQSDLGILKNDFNIVVSGIIPGSSEPMLMPSSLSRELYSAFEHTTHHLALIKMIGNQIGMSFDDSFGVATSTQQHLKA